MTTALIEEFTSVAKATNKLFTDFEEVKRDLAATLKRVAATQAMFNSLPEKLIQLNAKIDDMCLWFDAKLDEMRLSVTEVDELNLEDQLKEQAVEFDRVIENVQLLADRKLAMLSVNVGRYAFPTQKVI